MALTASKKRTGPSMAVKHAAPIEVGRGSKENQYFLRYGVSTGLIGDWSQNRVDMFKGSRLKQSLLAE